MKEEQAKIKQFEETLADFEEYIRQFWDFLPIPVALISPGNVVQSATRALIEFSGYQESEIVGSSLKDMFLKKHFIEEILKEVRRKGRVEGKEGIFLTKRGREIPVRTSAMARTGEQGEFFGYFFSAIDVSATKQFEERLKKEVQKKTQQLQERLEELEKYRRLTEGRELRMIELKERIKELEEKLE